MNARTRRLLAGAVAGLAAGVAIGVLTLVVTGSAGAHQAASGTVAVQANRLAVVHLPPLLTVPGETVELRYDIYCPGSTESDAPCDAGGTIYVRAGESGPFRAVELRVDPAAQEGRYVAQLPADVAASRAGFSYYAVLRDNAGDASTTLPAGGASAPQRSLPMGNGIAVDLGPHRFDTADRADARVVRAGWGIGAGQAGLEEGPEATPIGGSAFDVDASGTVTVLDEANRRALRFRPGTEGPSAVPLPISGRIADMSVGPDGTMYVLDTPGPTPRFRSCGSSTAAGERGRP